MPFNHFTHDSWSNTTRRQADNAVHVADCGDDFLVGDDDTATATRQAELRQAHAQHGIRVPQRSCFAEDNARERHAIGIVDNQRYPVLVRQGVELFELFIGNDVTRWVCRARNADHSGVFANRQIIEINVIFKLPFREQLNMRAGWDEQIVFQTGIRVADVFGSQRKQHLAGRTIRASTCEQIEQVEKRALAAIC